MTSQLSAHASVCCGGSCTCEEEVHAFEGRHLIASYMDCDGTALCDLDRLRKAMKEAVLASGATILNISYHAFELNNGLTMMLLLSESHASIHTYPEHRACFVDIFTCGDTCNPERFHEVLASYLRPERVSKKLLVRHEKIE